MFRLIRIVMDEYYGLKEKILIESPFAEVNVYGEGIRQVQLALTRKYILIGEDRFDREASEKLLNVYPKPDIDPEFESMQLIEILPLKAIRLKMYRRENREMLKIIAGNSSKLMYFEFGGHLLKRMYWILWKDRVENMKISTNKYSKFLPYVDPCTEPDTPLTSNSEYEMPKKIKVFADVHISSTKIKNKNNSYHIEHKTLHNQDNKENTPNEETIMNTIHRYFVDALTNSRLRILDNKLAYNSIFKSNSEPDYIVDLSNAKDNIDYSTLNRKSISTGLIRSIP